MLLSNDGVLPLDRQKLRRIAVIGPNAERAHLGGYSVDPGRGVSLLDGVRAAAGAGIEVRYARGCNITSEDLTWEGFWKGKVTLPEPEAERRLVAEAVRVARGTDVVIVAIGENEATSRETWDSHLGDRDSLSLLGAQDELVAALAATGVPIVLVVVGARPLSIGDALGHSRAAIGAFYLGQEGGTALAEILFGDVAPSGHLPMTWPKSAGQLPVYYYRKPSARGDYLFSDADPLFPFGWGLSYTTFEHSPVRVEPSSIRSGERARVSVTVRNTGARAGTSVVQLYVGAASSSVTRAVRLLRGFERVQLQPGEAREVSFEIGPEDLALWDLSMQRTRRARALRARGGLELGRAGGGGPRAAGPLKPADWGRLTSHGRPAMAFPCYGPVRSCPRRPRPSAIASVSSKPSSTSRASWSPSMPSRVSVWQWQRGDCRGPIVRIESSLPEPGAAS